MTEKKRTIQLKNRYDILLKKPGKRVQIRCIPIVNLAWVENLSEKDSKS
jgi:hypothetical protein